MPSARRLRTFAWTAAILLAGAARTRAQTAAPESFPVDIELGYRFVDVGGNDQEYRTQINDRPGVLLRSLDYAAPGSLGLLDTLQITGTDIGAGPAGQFRLLAAQTDVFRLNFTWRETDLYSALPAFANPFLDQGIIPGQQTWNRTRNIYDVNLELLPGKIVSPILGYTRNVYDGPGTTTYHVGQNEFQQNDFVESVDQLWRVGLGFNWNDIQAGFTQGWRQYHWQDVATLAPGANNGNNTTPLLGQPITAQTLTNTEYDKVNTPVTNAWLTANLFGRLKLIGTFVKADASDDTNFVEADLGQFLSFEIARFFSGLAETVDSKARTDYWRASGQAELSITSNVQVVGGWLENSRKLDGTALISDLYVDTVDYAGQSTGNLLQQINAHTEVDEMERTYNAGVSARQLGPFSVNAGWSQTQQNVTATPDASEIIIPGGQGGRYERLVNTLGGGAHVLPVGPDLDRQLPPRRGRRAHLPNRLHPPRPLRLPRPLELQGLPQARRRLPRDPRRRRHRDHRLQHPHPRVPGQLRDHHPQRHAHPPRSRRRVPHQPPNPHPTAPGLLDRPHRTTGVRS